MLKKGESSLGPYAAMALDCHDRVQLLLALDDRYESLVEKPNAQIDEVSHLIEKASGLYGKFTFVKKKTWQDIVVVIAKIISNLEQALMIIEVIDIDKPKKIEKASDRLKEYYAENTKLLKKLKNNLDKKKHPKPKEE